MARKLSRRDLAKYATRQLIEGVSVHDVARHVAAYLIETRRTSELDIIIRDIAAELALAGHMSGTVTATHELGTATLQEIEAYAKQKTGASHLSLDTIVDESVLGGIKLELPGHELDTTITRQLTLLKTRYKKA